MHPTRFLSLNQTLFTGSILKKRYSALSFLPQFGKFLRSCTKQNQIAVVECGNKITVKKDFYLESAKIVSLFGTHLWFVRVDRLLSKFKKPSANNLI